MAQRRRDGEGMRRAIDKDVQLHLEVKVEAEGFIGKRAWALLSAYGRLIEGPYSGMYVSGVPYDVQLEIVQRLVRGRTVPVHLMHRHRSGNHETSWLRWSQDDGLVMAFRDRNE